MVGCAQPSTRRAVRSVFSINLAGSYSALGREEQALNLFRDVYSGRLKLLGAEHPSTLASANNYAVSLKTIDRFEEARSLMRKTIPIARRILGEGNELTLTMRWIYAEALYKDPGATLDDLREAVTTLEDTERTARRVLGGAHPLVVDIGDEYRDAQAAFCARETLRPSPDAGRPSYNIPPWTMPLDDEYFI